MNVALIINAACLDKANALAEVMGWGPNSYSVPLSPDGTEPATHWGLNVAEARPEFLAMLAGAAEGEMPDGLIAAGYPAADFTDVIEALSVWTATPYEDAIAAMGLKAVTGSSVTITL